MGEMVVKHKHRFLFGLLLFNLTLYAQNPPPTYLSAVSGDEEVDLLWQPPGTAYTEGESCSFPFSGGLLTDEFSQIFEGSTDGFDNDYSNGFTAGGADVVYQFTVENDVAVTFSLCETLDWDTYLLLFDATCENLLAFDDDGCSGTNGFASEISATLSSGTYHLVVDGYGATSFGAYTFSVSGSAATLSTGTFSQNNTDLSKLEERDLTGSSIYAISEYNSGLEQTLDFIVDNTSPDQEWIDGFSLTFPEGWQVVSGQMEDGQLDAQVDGNLITFGDPFLGSGFGDLSGAPAQFPFEVTLIAPDGGGDVIVDYYIGGDVYGAEPHSISGELTLEENILAGGDLLGYRVYVDGTLHNDGIIGSTNYTVDGLTNNVAVELGVKAVYFLTEDSDEESAAVTISATPTYLYGDVIGTVTDPNNSPIADVLVVSGESSDITSEDGTYVLMNLETGIQTVQFSSDLFYNLSSEVEVLAQAEATILDIELSPDMPHPAGLDAQALDEEIFLTWRTPGNGEELEFQYYEGGLANAFYFNETYEDGFAHGTKFTVGGSFDVLAASVKVLSEGDEFWPWPNNTHGPIRVLVFDDLNGFPGDLLHDEEIVAENGWATVYPNIQGLEGSFYVLASHSGWTDPEGWAIDASVDYPDNMVTFLEGEWYYGDYLGYGGDYMTAAQVMSYGGGVTTLSSSNETPTGLNNFEINLSSSIIVDTQDLISINENFVEVTNPPYSPFQIESSSRDDELVGYNVYEVSLDGTETLVVTVTDTFTTVIANPNYLEYCYNVSAVWETDNYGELESRHSNISCAVPYALGDADFDSDTDINDVLTVIDFILEEDFPSEDEFRNVDVNMDVEINIADVVMMVDIIYGGNARSFALDMNEIAYVDLIQDYQNSKLGIAIDYHGPVRGIELELEYDHKMVNIISTGLSKLQDNVMVTSKRIGDGNLKVIVANLNSGLIENNENMYLDIPLEFNGDDYQVSTVSLKDIKIAGSDGNIVRSLTRTEFSDIKAIPVNFALQQNFPNPFNPSTEIRFDIPENEHVTLIIYNMMGQKVKTLASGNMIPGYHSIIWNGTNDIGAKVATGTYFYSINTSNFQSIRKMLFLK